MSFTTQQYYLHTQTLSLAGDSLDSSRIRYNPAYRELWYVLHRYCNYSEGSARNRKRSKFEEYANENSTPVDLNGRQILSPTPFIISPASISLAVDFMEYFLPASVYGCGGTVSSDCGFGSAGDQPEWTVRCCNFRHIYACQTPYFELWDYQQQQPPPLYTI